MAGDWIKMRTELRTDPAVLRIMRLTGHDEYAVIGRLHRFWSWIDAHATAGRVQHMSASDVDALVDGGVDAGFATLKTFAFALIEVGWLEELSTGRFIGLRVPNYESHNGDTAKKRALKSRRQARWRDAKPVDAPVDASVDAPVDAGRLPEKRREEKSITTKASHARKPVDNSGRQGTLDRPRTPAAPAESGEILSPKATKNGQPAPKLPGGWWRDPTLAAKAGALLGVAPLAGEDLQTYVGRVRGAMERQVH